MSNKEPSLALRAYAAPKRGFGRAKAGEGRVGAAQQKTLEH
jgi:hypothetical protein